MSGTMRSVTGSMMTNQSTVQQKQQHNSRGAKTEARQPNRSIAGSPIVGSPVVATGSLSLNDPPDEAGMKRSEPSRAGQNDRHHRQDEGKMMC